MTLTRQIVTFLLLAYGLFVSVGLIYDMGGSDPFGVLVISPPRVFLVLVGGWLLLLAALRSVSSASQHEMIFAGSACILAVATMQYSSWGAPLGLALIVGASMFSRTKQA